MNYIHTIELFPVLHQHLLELLHNLKPDDWQRPTVCKGWTIKDITAHIVDTELRRITYYRDNYTAPIETDITSLIDFLNKLNNDWVIAARRLSPAILIEWLEQTGPQVYELFRSLPQYEPAVHSVAWAGDETSPNWFHIAREYTELWHHQQQIRLAVQQTAPLMDLSLYYPLIATFIRALPHTYRNITAPEGTGIKVKITKAGEWYMIRKDNSWKLDEITTPSCEIIIDGEMAWRLFTKGITKEEAKPYVTIKGDQDLGTPIFSTLAVMA